MRIMSYPWLIKRRNASQVASVFNYVPNMRKMSPCVQLSTEDVEKVNRVFNWATEMRMSSPCWIKHRKMQIK
jgi:hypothetical protein